MFKSISFAISIIILINLILLGMPYFFEKYVTLDLTQEQTNKINKFLLLEIDYNKYVNDLPKLQYKTFKEKLKAGDFKSFRRVYSNASFDGYDVFTDKSNQKFVALMIQNSENNLELSNYYDDIIILPSITENMIKSRLGRCNNIDKIQTFMETKIPLKITDIKNGFGEKVEDVVLLPIYFYDLSAPGVGVFCPYDK